MNVSANVIEASDLIEQTKARLNIVFDRIEAFTDDEVSEHTRCGLLQIIHDSSVALSGAQQEIQTYLDAQRAV